MAGAQVAPVNAVAGCALKQRVIDVGDVLDVVNIVIIVQQDAVDQIKKAVE